MKKILHVLGTQDVKDVDRWMKIQQVILVLLCTFVYINLHIVSSSLLENSTYYIPTYMYPSIHFLPHQIFKGKSFLHTLFYFILSPKIFIMNSVH